MTLIRPAADSDLEAVVGIERECFANPWTREYFAAELRNRRCHFWVALASPAGAGAGAEAVLAGYMLFWRIDAEVELHKIAVAAASQRQGHASRFMERFIQETRAMACARAWLEVRAGNLAAIRLYEKYGFRRVGLRRGYYTRPDEDALVFELAL